MRFAEILENLPENMPLYKDCGLWQMRTDDMEHVHLEQHVSETDLEFFERCAKCGVAMLHDIKRSNDERNT